MTGKFISAGSGQTHHQENDGYHSSDFPDPTKVPELEETKEPGPAQVSVLRDHGQCVAYSVTTCCSKVVSFCCLQ